MNPEAVTAEWLTDALGAAGALPRGTRITAVDGERIGAGLVGLNVKFSLRYVEGSQPGPLSVVGKFPSPDPVSRATGIGMRNYEREVRFYQEVAATVAIRTPACYAAEIDLASGDFVLILEDLAPARPGDQVAGCDVEQAALAMVELAGLHGPRWGDPSLHEIEWLSKTTSETATMIQTLYQSVWPSFVAVYGATLEPEQLALAERFGSALADWLTDREPASTVTHGDYRLDNMLFGTAEGGYPLAVVDWQTPGHGPLTADAAYFLGAGLVVDERRRHEEDLLRRYHRALGEHGVSGYSWSQCWEDYRSGSLAGVLMTVIASMVVAADERGVAMFTAMAQRHTAHALDMGAGDILPS